MADTGSDQSGLARYESIQARDDTDIGTALKNIQQKRVERRARKFRTAD